MGEKEPKPLKPLYDTCLTCNKKYILAPKNTRIFLFTHQMECTYMHGECTHCSGDNLMFLQMDGNTLEEAKARDIEVIPNTFAPPHIFRTWLELNDLLDKYTEIEKKLEETYIPPTHEKKVKALGHYLMNNHITPEDFFGDGDLLI